MGHNRVCIIRHDYYPRENHVRRDAETLCQAGYDVDIICCRLQSEKRHEVINGVHVHRMPVSHERGGIGRYLFEYSTFFLHALFAVTKLHFRRRYSVIEVDTMPDFLVFSTSIVKAFGAKIILFMFEAMPEFFFAKYALNPENYFIKILKAVEKYAVRYADHIITVNSILKQRIDRRYGVDSNTSIILNVPYEELMKTPPGPETHGDFVLIYQGTLSYRYGVQVAIQAIPQVIAKIHNIRLVIVGDGDYMPELKRLVGKLELENHICFTGWLSFEKMVLMLSEADIGLVPFVRDGYTDLMLPNKLFEYIAQRIPVISARTDAIKSYFTESSLMFFEPGNARDLAQCIVTLHENPAITKSLIENASREYARHRWCHMKKEYLNIYRKLREN